MIKKREGGQAFILVLIILAIGALVVIPTLRLTTTVLKSNQIITQRNRGLYACEAAQEVVMWKLLYDIDSIVSENLTGDGDNISFTVDVCGTTVYASVFMRAVPGEGGITLAGDDVIMPTKTVTPSGGDTDPIPPGTPREYTYIITLEHISDNTTVKLDAIYDILPKDFRSLAYETGSSELSVDGGPWEEVPDPDLNSDYKLLKWPRDYDKDTGTGAFSSNPDFLGIQDFTPGQEKKLRFKVSGEFKNEGVYYNWVVLKPWNTLSGATAPITVGTPSENTSLLAMLNVDKTVDPELILPGVETPVDYTIIITNLRTTPLQIEEIVDYLPPEFYYTDNSTSGLTSDEPQKDSEYICGAERQVLRWTISEFPGGDTVKIDEGGTLTLTFRAQTTKEVSGTYYNEVFVFTDLAEGDLRDEFAYIGVSLLEFGSTYSWNSGTVIVPAYDSTTGAEGENITANMALESDHVRIISWNVQ